MSFTEPDELHTTFAAAFEAGDVESLVDLYEPDAVQVQPGGPIVSGHDSLAESFSRMIQAGMKMQGDPQKAVIVGDIALTSTHYEFSTDAPDGSRTTTHVATAEVSRRQADGSWRLVIDSPAFA